MEYNDSSRSIIGVISQSTRKMFLHTHAIIQRMYCEPASLDLTETMEVENINPTDHPRVEGWWCWCAYSVRYSFVVDLEIVREPHTQREITYLRFKTWTDVQYYYKPHRGCWWPEIVLIVTSTCPFTQWNFRVISFSFIEAFSRTFRLMLLGILHRYIVQQCFMKNIHELNFRSSALFAYHIRCSMFINFRLIPNKLCISYLRKI